MAPRIVISGATGRMGQTLMGLIAKSGDFELLCGIDRERLEADAARAIGFPAVETAETGGDAIVGADALIDFSAPEGLQTLLERCAGALERKALVVGTTGLSGELQQKLHALSKRAPVIVSANYSIGVNLMLGVVASAARVLAADRYDVEIVETHHRHKADAPSGTALLLGKVVADARGQDLSAVRRDGRSGKSGERPIGEVGLHAIRGGEVVGEHRVMFLGASERFEIVHAAADRALFAEGALLAAKFLVGKPAGMYTMQDVLGLSKDP